MFFQHVVVKMYIFKMVKKKVKILIKFKVVGEIQFSLKFLIVK